MWPLLLSLLLKDPQQPGKIDNSSTFFDKVADSIKYMESMPIMVAVEFSAVKMDDPMLQNIDRRTR